ncbi:unnamed protein product [Peniophora sp. CBMAI 1063]|nr:unnamed protein product [Peniophora sp. CBMAI 1063]
MGRNRNGRKKQLLGVDNHEQSQASSLLIDFEHSDPPAENATTAYGGLDGAEDVGGDVGAYMQEEPYADEAGSSYGAREYAESPAMSGLSQQLRSATLSMPPPAETRFFSEADFNDDSDGERVGDVDIHTDDPGARYISEAAPSSPPGISDELPASGKQVTTPRPTSGHVRTPSIPKRPTRMDNLSKAVNNYVPSSLAIAIPSAALSPPRVARPLSFATFMSPTSDNERHSMPPGPPPSDPRRQSWGSDAGHKTLDEVLSLDNPHSDPSQAPGMMRYPSGDADNSERILWSRWDTVVDGPITRRWLLVGYLRGMQIWDCTSLDAPKELLNLPDVSWGRIWQASVLPSPASGPDQLQRARPLIGIIAKQTSRDPRFLIYSLHSHDIIKTIAAPGLVSFSANNHFIVLSTSNPTSITVLSACTFSVLHVISAPSLVPFFRPLPTNNNAQDTSVLLPDIDPTAPPADHEPRPVFALSHRLLAFASTPPRSDTKPGGSITTSTINQADLRDTALRVGTTIGTSVLSGMRSLGGMAITAARSRMAGPTAPMPAPPARPFQSRSAPSRRASVDISDDVHLRGDPSSAAPVPTVGNAFVTVLDLRPLLHDDNGKPEGIAEWEPSQRAHVAALRFSEDGTQVVVVPEDGQTLPVFRLRPPSRAKRRVAQDTDSVMPEDGQPHHIYDLRRGRTSGHIEVVEPASDGRWVAIGSRKRTVHVFATNPYGGPADERSHVSGRVLNSLKLPPASTTSVAPIKRLYAHKPPITEVSGAPIPPLAFTFITSSSSLPKSLLPPSAQSPPSSRPTSAGSSPSPEPLSPVGRRRPTNYQDLLSFDPVHGTLTLYRLFIETRGAEGNALVVPGTGYSLPLTSISLPARPSFAGSSKTPVSALSKMMERSSELIAREAEVAVWPLRRARDWEALRTPLSLQVPSAKKRVVLSSKPSWLAYAELQTSSLSKRIMPRTIYLQHQFSFFALNDDYHGLLRRHKYNLAGRVIAVRRAVSVSAHPTSAGDAAFLAHEHGGTPASFDESLSSAITSSLEYPSSPPVIPMYPNGAPGTSGSFKNSLPIHRMADNVTDGIGRLRSQIGRVRSPRVLPSRGEQTSTSVPLEFDEEDEDFVLERGGRRMEDDALSHATSQDDGPSVSTPSSGADVLDNARGHEAHVEESDPWPSWEHAVDEVEPFDEISAVGFMDEEHDAHSAGLQRTVTAKASKKKRRARGVPDATLT